jgi:2-polyprenyl-3-methyl-5-hydroxy-6-metoxy-1,4-benzoquinol methylase
VTEAELDVELDDAAESALLEMAEAAESGLTRVEDEHVATVTVDRPLRKHANAKIEKDVTRQFDKTALHADLHGRLISHSDYIAHSERWDYVWRSIRKGERIIDVGCGTDTPLMRGINFNLSQSSKVMAKNGGCYIGVDVNKLKPTKINWAQLIGEFDFTTRARELPEFGTFTLAVSLEVIEHMPVADGRRLLEAMRDSLVTGGRIIMSTPVYDGVAMARNHIHEYYADELRDLILDVGGLEITKRMGTFTSEPQLLRWMKLTHPEWLEIYYASREFHSATYMSGLFAPLVPDISRNNTWLLTKVSPEMPETSGVDTAFDYAI